uniref:DNA-directed RNA polymerase III subunit RPC4-like n=1 Tax=Myxine glutinosa TaxID=7769 RepID=UPI00358FF428
MHSPECRSTFSRRYYRENIPVRMIFKTIFKAADGSQGSVCSLKTLPEGPLGRLQLHKSGRVQLVLGHVSLDVTMGTGCSFLQELVSIRLREGRGGELVVLGKVGTRLICSPDFPSLLGDAN